MLTIKSKASDRKDKKKVSTLSIFYEFKRDIFFLYAVTFLSAFLNSIFDQNTTGKIFEKLASEKIEEGVNFFSMKGLFKSQFASAKGIIFFSFCFLLLYCSIVLIHVYYNHYLNNKINLFLKNKLIKKLFQLRDSPDKKTTLALFNSDVKTFSDDVVFFPNQIFYLFLSTVFSVYLIYLRGSENKEMAEKAQTTNLLLFSGLYFIAILVVSSILQSWIYWVDLKFRDILKNQIREEDVIINNRDLIIKKALVDASEIKYSKMIKFIKEENDKRDLVYTNSWVIISYLLLPFFDTLSLLFFKNKNGVVGKSSSNLLFIRSLISKIFESVKKMNERIRDYPYFFSASRRINNFLNDEERDDIQKNLLFSEPIRSISLKSVCFGYKKDKLVIKKLNIQFELGKINHLVGQNGFGKSTIISLIIGLYQPLKGQILINNSQNLNEINLINWRNKIAYSEHQNLVENGLSTGQKQLIDIEKTLNNYQEKEVFIFDEADNALDQHSKEEFRKKLEEISKNKLVILISH
jgi:ABC-type multidrug transport system fused ATPase/permease subunit